MGRPRLIVFGRLPEPGHAKTRLSPGLTAAGSAELYEAFLEDAMGLAPRGVETQLWVPDRPRAVERLGARYPGASVRLQPEGSLGDRLEMAFACAFNEGVGRAVAVGSDHPTLPPDFIDAAFEALRTARLVLGPTRDGGYYAMGLSSPAWPAAQALFAGAPWSEPDLCGWTRARAVALGLRPVELPSWYDVDLPGDLARMEGDLRQGSATARAWARLRSPSATGTRGP
ncbi:TIGR04282 family arsenosugar biosynthesis glycosyltransferase [Candidatus Palauibacter sp.]|uniref:TIGR04282 family arsenosugar biosynthesis glycosyltransferase n=1 Tax=Candidatus Palauibacter sp. TaxID=3101350 RepID=UPI003B5972E2